MFRQYGEVNNARALVREIIYKRVKQPINTVNEFIGIITKLAPSRKENKYLAQVFQALRIEVNNELEVLKEMLQDAVKVIKPGGRIAVISYHSLEDRLVKYFMQAGNFQGEQQKDIYGNIIRPLEPVNRKPIIPGDLEIKENKRARSAKLRIAEKHGE